MQQDHRSTSPCDGILATCKNIVDNRVAAHTYACAFLYRWSECTARSRPMNRLLRWTWLRRCLLFNENNHTQPAADTADVHEYELYNRSLEDIRV